MAKVSPRARALAAATLILRIITLGLLAASLAVIAPFSDGIRVVDLEYNISFKDLYMYRYLLSVAAIGCAYSLVLIFVAVIAVVVQRQKIGGTSAAGFLIFIDVVICALLTSGGAAGLGFVVDYQRSNGKSFDSAQKKFYTLFDTSCGLLLAAAVCTVVMIMISVSSK